MARKAAGCLVHFLQALTAPMTLTDALSLTLTVDQTAGVRGTERVQVAGTKVRACSEHAPILRAAAAILTAERQTDAAEATNRSRWTLPDRLTAAMAALPSAGAMAGPMMAAVERIVWEELTDDRSLHVPMVDGRPIPDGWDAYLTVRDGREGRPTIGWDSLDEREDRREEVTVRRYAVRTLEAMDGATAEMVADAMADAATMDYIRSWVREAMDSDYLEWQRQRRTVVAQGPILPGPYSATGGERYGFAMLSDAPAVGRTVALIRFEDVPMP